MGATDPSDNFFLAAEAFAIATESDVTMVVQQMSDGQESAGKSGQDGGVKLSSDEAFQAKWGNRF